ncbi:hypothetical protein F383_12323 [Gossypium arboreum]|uniref:Uncharacterized protein n=1 Tax=Gossypium arboreum TaxID=29729 RepID=A0A0B0PSW1_GOSAR|nr:hypothetical protein F383_12323 [Gossypium arboreum]
MDQLAFLEQFPASFSVAPFSSSFRVYLWGLGFRL